MAPFGCVFCIVQHITLCLTIIDLVLTCKWHITLALNGNTAALQVVVQSEDYKYVNHEVFSTFVKVVIPQLKYTQTFSE